MFNKAISIHIVLFLLGFVSTAFAVTHQNMLDVVNRYNTFQQKIGSDIPFETEEEINSLFHENFKKVVNGVVLVDGRSHLRKQLEDVKAIAGTWNIVAKEQVPCLDVNLCIIRYHLISKNSGSFDVMALVRKNNNGLIEEINEIYYKIIQK